MSIYFNRYRAILELKIKDGDGNIEEPDVDEGVDGDNEEPEEETDTEVDEEEETEEDPTDYTNIGVDEGDNESADKETDDDDTNDNEEATDYTSMDDREQSDTDSSELTDDDTNDNNTESDSSDIEKELFDNVSPEQMNIKLIKLKKEYKDIYHTLVNILTRVNKIERSTVNTNVVEFIVNKLLELKDMLSFYLENTFNTKSYIENNINYQQYLLTLNTIDRLFKEIVENNDNNKK